MTYDLNVVCGLINYVYLWQHPCSLCMSPKQSLNKVGKKFDHWSKKGMQALVMKMLTSTKKDVDLLSNENSVHVIKAR
jgi:hypothetical protein